LWEILGDNMKKILLLLTTLFLFSGCSETKAELQPQPKLLVNNSLQGVVFKDQYEKPHAITSETKKVVFAFSKGIGHACNDFFATKDTKFLEQNKALFVADVSAAPSLIRSMFIIPGLQDFRHTILVIEDEAISSNYKIDDMSEKLVVVSLDNFVITDIVSLESVNDLENHLQ
jgi:hypothetical protein